MQGCQGLGASDPGEGGQGVRVTPGSRWMFTKLLSYRPGALGVCRTGALPQYPLQFVSGSLLGNEGDTCKNVGYQRLGAQQVPFPCNWMIGKNKSDSILDLFLLF